jgi:hypothetical protein
MKEDFNLKCPRCGKQRIENETTCICGYNFDENTSIADEFQNQDDFLFTKTAKMLHTGALIIIILGGINLLALLILEYIYTEVGHYYFEYYLADPILFYPYLFVLVRLVSGGLLLKKISWSRWIYIVFASLETIIVVYQLLSGVLTDFAVKSSIATVVILLVPFFYLISKSVPLYYTSLKNKY